MVAGMLVMMVMMMAVMVLEVQSRLQAINRGRGGSNNPIERHTDRHRHSIAYFLFVAFTIFLFSSHACTLDLV